MKSILPFDELNALKVRIRRHFDETTGRIKSRKDCEDILDELLDLLLLAYAEGVNYINSTHGTAVELPLEAVEAAVYKRIDGATWRDRVIAWYEADGNIENIMEIARTESHRDYEAAKHDAAEAAGLGKKKWNCMMLSTSRDSHVYLNGVSVPMNGYFYSYRGCKTRYPGEWGDPEEDCNCLCCLTFDW